MKENKYYKQINTIIENIEVNSKVRQYQDNFEKLQGYWNIGKLIVEAQGDKERAKYGNNLINKWALMLTNSYGKHYTSRNLRYMRLFYINFPIWNAVRSKLSWTQYRLILPINNENERNYYINQVLINNLSSRDLQKEIKSKSFDRLSYADKENIELIKDNNYELNIEDMIKDPILINVDNIIKDLDEKAIHKYIISMLENKFLDLGQGFALISHEYKIIINDTTYKIDLLFFNIELNAYVAVEVKSRKVKTQDISQLNFYVNYIDRNIKKSFHKKTIGILIVKKNDKFVIEYTTNNDIYITTYKIINN